MLKYTYLSVLSLFLFAAASLAQYCTPYGCYPDTYPRNQPGYSAPYRDFNSPATPNLDEQIRVKIENACVIVRSEERASWYSSGVGYRKGSGTIIKYGDAVAVITAAHVVSGSQTAVIYLREEAQSEEGITCRVCYYNNSVDFAILEPQSRQEVLYQRGVELFSGNYEQSWTFIATGYDGGVRLRMRIFNLLRRVRGTTFSEYYWLEFSRPSVPGDSGAGVFSPDGRLFAIIHSTSESRTYATIISPVTEYLNANQTCLLWRFRRQQPQRPPENRPPESGPPSTPPEVPGPSQPPQDKPPESQPPEEKPRGGDGGDSPPHHSPPPSPPVPSVWSGVVQGVILGLVAYVTFILVVLVVSVFKILGR